MKESLSRYYKLPLTGGLEALYVTNYNTSFPFHYHHTFNITLVYHGIFQSQLNNRLITAPEGSIQITNPYEIHANPCEKVSRVSFFTFYLADDLMTACNAGQPVVFNDKVIYDAGLFARLHNLSLAISHGQVMAPGAEEELIKICRLLAKKHGSARAAAEAIKTNRLFEEFLAEENLAKFSLQDAAHRFGIDKFKFLRLFKYQTGLTPNNYFILKRIEKSKAMLTEGQDLLGNETRFIFSFNNTMEEIDWFVRALKQS